jgi:hypothetical protein
MKEKVPACATPAKSGEIVKAKEAPPRKRLKNMAFLVFLENPPTGGRLTAEEESVL